MVEFLNILAGPVGCIFALANGIYALRNPERYLHGPMLKYRMPPNTPLSTVRHLGVFMILIGLFFGYDSYRQIIAILHR